MKFQKISGGILLIIGIIIICWSLYSSYNIFIGKNPAPEIFKIGEKKLLTSDDNKIKLNSPAEIQKQMEKIIGEQIKEIIPAKTITTFLNLISWSIFASILILAGSKISSIGIQLIK